MEIIWRHLKKLELPCDPAPSHLGMQTKEIQVCAIDTTTPEASQHCSPWPRNWRQLMCPSANGAEKRKYASIHWDPLLVTFLLL